jgi:predicted enzyme related to lactoylglutathione lyase
MTGARRIVSAQARHADAEDPMALLVNIDVDDLEKAVAFYGAAFGLHVGRRFGASAVELLGSSAPLYLLAKPAGTPASGTTTQARHYERHWTPVHLDFVVDDIESAVERAARAGAELEQPIATQRWGKLALMADPFGHGFCFVEFTGRGYDEIAD